MAAMTADGEEFMTVADIARILKLNQQTVRNCHRPGIAAGAACRPERARAAR